MFTKDDRAKWIVIAAFFRGQENRWLDDFIVDDQIVFEKISPLAADRDWHKGKSKITPLLAWFGHLRHAKAALRGQPDGIIACFPQLAICAAFWKRLGRSKPAIIAYNFNLGALRSGLRQRLARAVAGEIDCFVVHSPDEVARYATYLDVPQERVQFVPLQRGQIKIARKEDIEAPFILSMGSAHRDYPTLIKAVNQLNYPTVIVTRASDIATFPESANVTYRSGLTEKQCLDLMARARMCVTPIANMTTASGQITFINAMHLGTPVIATRCPGTEGYIKDGYDGVLVAPFDVDDLTAAIDQLWQDETQREALAKRASETARARFSDQAASLRLHEILKTTISDSDRVGKRS
ncbi:glycosyltransferase family 4 protein [Octadecabacter sp. CECT 8868]|uniref:glycosyltransferase family 4 protein n=1 Tax=Octadecabacter algicola TaxID=2909342 RepID=UPI001F3FA1AB|nr:glycosyltransferase family 4 protein [Octadecabacter algicola]MCF2906656.1 glycosyltransferase family 4 protein [Octadecabacter algicola]